MAISRNLDPSCTASVAALTSVRPDAGLHTYDGYLNSLTPKHRLCLYYFRTTHWYKSTTTHARLTISKRAIQRFKDASFEPTRSRRGKSLPNEATNSGPDSEPRTQVSGPSLSAPTQPAVRTLSTGNRMNPALPIRRNPSLGFRQKHP